MIRTQIRCLLLALILFGGVRARADGSGYNVLIVVNQNSTNSVQLGNYYRAERQVPPLNFLRVNWTGGNTEWTISDFTNTLLNPVRSYITTNHLTNQILYIVLSMDFPYRINAGTNYYNSTTAALFYGFVNDPTYAEYVCELASGSSNAYAGSEGIFRATPPNAVSTNTNSWLAVMLTAADLPTAEMAVQQGVAGDSTFPTQNVWLNKSTQAGYNARFTEYDNTVFNMRLRTNYSVMRTNLGSPVFNSVIAGCQNGAYAFAVNPLPLFVPGAVADNLNSYGGILFEDTSGETTLLAFIEYGASGSYGTVIEPCSYLEKFPDSQNYLYQSRGFSLAEGYYQSVTNPYQGLVVGEPLSAPFAQPASGSWSGIGSNSILAGTTNLSVQFTASDAWHPVQQLDLFLDGAWLQTVTNIAPQSGNVINVTLNGYATSYSVPASATIKSVATGLTSALNQTSYANNTKVTAYQHGDRIELQSTAAYTKTGAQISLSLSSTNSSGALTTFIHASPTNPTNFLDSIAQGYNSFELSGTPPANAHLSITVTKTNSTLVTLNVTNTSSTNDLNTLAGLLINAINSSTDLQGSDGLSTGDYYEDATNLVEFNLYANSAGYAAAQIKASINGSSGISISPPSVGGGVGLNVNADDLRPRNHLYITAGVSNLTVIAPFNSTNYPDGYHELEAVVYEGSHVHTQGRIVQQIVIKNTSLTATLTPTLTGTNSALQPTLQFFVVASTNNLRAIQLFSTGGLIGSVSNQASAWFTITLSNLYVGLHPFYAIVTDNSGHQFRTPTQTIGLVGVDYAGGDLLGVDLPFTLQVSGPGLTFTFPATAGRTYDILSTTNLSSGFQLYSVVVPTNSLGQWTETNRVAAQQFYRVSVAP